MIARNRALVAGVVMLLALLNLWKWLPMVSLGRKMGKVRSLEPKLSFPSFRTAADRKVRRDLFTFGRSLPKDLPGKGTGKAGPSVRARAVPSPMGMPAPGKAQEAFRLMGVLSRNGTTQALIARGDQLFQVTQGDELDNAYRVKSIGVDEVYLTEEKTGNTLKVEIGETQGADP